MIVFLVFSMTFCWATNPCDFFVISGYGDDCEKGDFWANLRLTLLKVDFKNPSDSDLLKNLIEERV